ncbi:unnamed protein product [Medioppia subpectinata]|uniref:Eukaryotic translation initiation factor 3 subunit E N-terminal domain-containing protein n=1 Tax=Medioppia subpectinata TaxID=1979941 RepID=A0A7R9KSM3_9ACAR|nr:unnamed protein product [Medioppia subpectinata]CAG2109078.1 unnamed protein product [Medioppia subpectinata]
MSTSGTQSTHHLTPKMAEWDLTTRLGKYLDRHLVFPLLEFLSVKEIYEENELLEGKLELLSNTNMVDFALDVYQRLNPGVKPPEYLYSKRSEVVGQLKQLQIQTEPMLEILLNPEVSAEIEKSRDSRQLFELLQTKYDVSDRFPTPIGLSGRPMAL